MIETMQGYNQVKKKTANMFRPFIKYNENRSSYSIQNSHYADFINWAMNEADRHSRFGMTKNEHCLEYFYSKKDQTGLKLKFLFLGLLEALGIIVYKIEGGDSPEIFVRINSKYQIERTLKSPQLYENHILSNVYNRHRMSVHMLTYLFENQLNTSEFWDKIEDYFLGIIPDEVVKNYNAH